MKNQTIRIMQAILFVVFVIMLAGIAREASAETVRHRTTVYAFKVTHVCPATKKKGNFPCPGYIVDHVVPLCKNGPDAVSNMQWQTIADAKAKDKVECKNKKAVK